MLTGVREIQARTDIDQEQIGSGVSLRSAYLRRYLFPVETAVVSFALLTFVVYRIWEVPLRQPGRLFIHHLYNCIIAYGVGLLLCALFLRLRHLRNQVASKQLITIQDSAKEFVAHYFRLGEVFYDLRFLAAVSLMFTGYVNFMHIIPQINPTLYDDWFIDGERALFKGEIGSQVLLRMFGFSAAPILSELYTLFYSYTGALIVTFVVQRNRLLGQRFFLAFALMWFTCALTVVTIPTYGPCYYMPELFTGMPQTGVSEMQLQAWRMKLFLAEYPKSDIGFYLICAFPSLHIAVPALGAIFLRPLSKLAAQLSIVYTLITVVTTVYFGWHYFLDDIAGIVMAILATMVSVLLIRGTPKYETFNA